MLLYFIYQLKKKKGSWFNQNVKYNHKSIFSIYLYQTLIDIKNILIVFIYSASLDYFLRLEPGFC